MPGGGTVTSFSSVLADAAYVDDMARSSVDDIRHLFTAIDHDAGSLSHHGNDGHAGGLSDQGGHGLVSSLSDSGDGGLAGGPFSAFMDHNETLNTSSGSAFFFCPEGLNADTSFQSDSSGFQLFGGDADQSVTSDGGGFQLLLHGDANQTKTSDEGSFTLF